MRPLRASRWPERLLWAACGAAFLLLTFALLPARAAEEPSPRPSLHEATRSGVEALLPDRTPPGKAALLVPAEATEVERCAAVLARFFLRENGVSTLPPPSQSHPVPDSGLPEFLQPETSWKLTRHAASTALLLRIGSENGSTHLLAARYDLPRPERASLTRQPFALEEDLEFLRAAEPSPLPERDRPWLRLLRRLSPPCEPGEDPARRLAHAVGRHLFRRGLWSAAARQLEPVAGTKPDRCLLHRSIALQLGGTGEVALQEVETAIQLKPDSGPLYTLKAWLLLRRGAPDDAVMLLEQARLSDVGREGFYHLARHLLALDRENSELALEALEKAIEPLPRDPYVQLVAARFYWSQAQLEKAVAAFRRALEAGAARREGAELWAEFAMALDASGKTEEAIAAFREGSDLEPGNASLARHLASLLRGTGRYDEALEILARAARARPERPELFVAWGDAAARMWRTEQAEQAYRLALEAEETPEARVGLARMLDRRGRLQRAQKMLEELLTRHPHHGDARVALGNVLARRGQTKRTVETLQQAARESDSEATARIALSQHYRRTGEHKEAIHQAQIALAADTSPAGYAALARAFVASGDFDNARTAIEKGLDSTGTSAQLQLAAAHLHAAQENFSDALKAVREVLDLNPHHPPALILAGRIHRELGQPEQAAALWTRAAQLDRWNAPLEWELAELLRHELNQPQQAAPHYARHAALDGAHAEEARKLARKN